MSKRTIAKIGALVIGIALVGACSRASSRDNTAGEVAEFSTDYEKPIVSGRLESGDITESSGIAASLCQSNVFWTHNDAGDDAYIFAIDTTGKHLGAFRVTGAQNDDWEDIASLKDAGGTCFLLIGDIGNNKAEKSVHKIYRVKEPTLGNDAASSTRKNALPTEPAETLQFTYPGKSFDAEALLAHQQSGSLYVLTKRVDGPSGIFRIAPNFGSNLKAEMVAEISLPAVPNGVVTGGAISADGKRVILCDYTSGYELQVGGGNFDDVWKSKPVKVDLGDRKQGEAVTFSADGKLVIATSEKRNSPVITVKRK